MTEVEIIVTEVEFIQNVKEVEFNQGLLWCDYSNLVEGVYQCLKQRAFLEFFGCEDCVH